MTALLNGTNHEGFFPPTGTLHRAIADLRAEVARLQEEGEARQQEVRLLRRQVTNNEAWKEQVIERLHKEADDRDYCSEFDDVMEDLGLPRRRRTYRVVVHATVEVAIMVEAQDEDDARDEAREYDDLADEVRRALQNGASFNSISTDTVERL